MPESMDRRRLLAGLGGAALVGGALAVTGAGTAEAAGPSSPSAKGGSNRAGQLRQRPLIAPPFTPTPGLRYVALSGYELKSDDPTTAVIDVGGLGAGPQPNDAFCTADVDVPDRAVIKELHAWGSGGVSISLSAQPYGLYSWSGIGGVVTAAGSGLQYGMSAVSDYVVDRSVETYIWQGSLLSTDAISSMLIGYKAGLTSFVPITPARVYDSRYVTPATKMTSLTNRTLSVANSYAPGSGTIAIHDVVPVGATAISFNLTVVGTTGAGYLSVNPGGTPAVTASSINWSGGMTLANGLTVALDASRQIKVFCVGGTANLIIDVLGYYI
jgi:hypothetical protein